jgi:glycosyltransferase involved in cell wall biosynthesis
LDAFANGSSKAHVVFIGHGTLESRVIEFSARHANIHLHAAVPHDEVVSLVASADYGLCLVENVSLSDYYCLPNKLFEYCFARLPVLASNFPEIGGLVAKFRLGVCCDPDPASVRQALHEIVANRPSFPVEDISSLSWDAQAQRLVDVYQQQLLVESATEAGSTVG